MLYIVKFIYNMIFFQEGFVLYSIFYLCNEIFLYVEFDKTACYRAILRHFVCITNNYIIEIQRHTFLCITIYMYTYETRFNIYIHTSIDYSDFTLSGTSSTTVFVHPCTMIILHIL